MQNKIKTTSSEKQEILNTESPFMDFYRQQERAEQVRQRFFVVAMMALTLAGGFIGYFLGKIWK